MSNLSRLRNPRSEHYLFIKLVEILTYVRLFLKRVDMKLSH